MLPPPAFATRSLDHKRCQVKEILEAPGSARDPIVLVRWSDDTETWEKARGLVEEAHSMLSSFAKKERLSLLGPWKKLLGNWSTQLTLSTVDEKDNEHSLTGLGNL